MTTEWRRYLDGFNQLAEILERTGFIPPDHWPPPHTRYRTQLRVGNLWVDLAPDVAAQLCARGADKSGLIRRIPDRRIPWDSRAPQG